MKEEENSWWEAGFKYAGEDGYTRIHGEVKSEVTSEVKAGAMK
jgi:hypothetical protein